MVILITDGDGKGDLGMVTAFCSHNQVKIEASEVFTAICQHDSPMPTVFMVRRYTNTPLISQVTSKLLYLNVSDLPQGTSSGKFPLDYLLLRSNFHILRLKHSYPMKRGRWGTEHIPFLQRFYENAPKSCTASPTQCYYQCLYQPPPCQEKSIQMGENQAITWPFNAYKTSIRIELDWKVSKARRLRSWSINIMLGE